MRRRGRAWRAAATTSIAAVAIALAAGCGGNADAEDAPSLTDTLAQVEGLTATQRLDRLAKLARDEGGELSLYTSINGDVADEIVGEFEDRFDVDVAVYRASDETIVRRLREERDADFHGADVVDTNGPAMVALHDAGQLDAYPFDRTQLVDGAVLDDWAVARFQHFVTSWNTKSERPASLAALAAPAWRDRIGLEAGDYDWYASVRAQLVAGGRSEAEVDRLLDAIARNARIIRGHTLLGQLVAAGELDVGLTTFAHLTDRLADDGAPIAWQPVVEPSFLRPAGIGLIAGSRHPATAALYLDWALSRSGQKTFVDEGYVSPRRDLQPAGEGSPELIDPVEIAKDEERWLDEWSRLISLGRLQSGS